LRNKGHRIKLSDQYDVAINALILTSALALPVAITYYQPFLNFSEVLKIKWGVSGLLTLPLIVGLCLFFLYHWVPYFQNKRDYRQVLRYMLDQQLFRTVKRQDGKSESKQLYPVYVKKEDYATLSVTYEMTGKVLQQGEKIASDLEKIFFADFKAQHDFRRNALFSKRAYSQFVFSDNKEYQRLKLENLVYDKKLGIRLMDGEYWDFVKNPHLLIAGGTGGGKTIFLLCLLKVLGHFSLLEICDPKKSDLSVLEHFPVFKGHVHVEIEEIINCLKETVIFMEHRYRQMGLNAKNPEEIKIGNNFQSFRLPPKFIVVDEWTAFVASLDPMKARVVDDLMAQLILKGRQAGVFLIVAMQRPDAQYLSANLRDNMVGRIALGRLSKTGYRMIFGEGYSEKNYLFIKNKIGRGYAALDGERPSEFFSPLIDFNSGFSFESVFAQMKPLYRVQKKKEAKEETYNLSELAKEFHLSTTTLTRVVQYLKESAYEFILQSGQFTAQDKTLFLKIINDKKKHPEQNWKEVVQRVLDLEKEI
jgi:hypothetical protein